VEKPSDLFKKGDEVEAAILNIDPVEQRISLSRKRLLSPPPQAVTAPAGEEDSERRGRRDGASRDNRPKRPKGKGGPREGRSLRERDFDYGGAGSTAAYNNYDPTVAASSNTNVKLGDVFGDLLSQLSLEEDNDKQAEKQS
jgi:small subunit ribosomal protein S1